MRGVAVLMVYVPRAMGYAFLAEGILQFYFG